MLRLLLGIAVLLHALCEGIVAEERLLPWSAKGRVTDIQGQPVSGAVIYAHCGIGSLHPTGKAVSDTNGLYTLRFGPGVLSSSRGLVQAATISVHLDGWFETNLHRQGDMIAALELPTEPIHWAGKTTNDLFLPGLEKPLEFVLAPAALVKGTLTGEDGRPLGNRRVGITGTNLPPSSSVLAETRTRQDGQFEFKNVPTGYHFRLYAEDPKVSWREWPFKTIRLGAAEEYEYRLKFRDGRIVEQ